MEESKIQPSFHLLDKVQGPLRLQWPENPSSALHLLDAGQAGETTYVLCRN